MVYEAFRKFSKDDLIFIGNLFGMDVSALHRDKKDRLLEAVSDYFRTQPQEWLSHLSETELKELRMMVKAGPARKIQVPYSFLPSNLSAINLVDMDVNADDGEDVNLSYSLPGEIYDLVRPYVDDAIKEGRESGRFIVEQGIMGILNLYGVLPFRTFIKMMFDFHDQVMPEDKDYTKFNLAIKRSQMIPMFSSENKAARSSGVLVTNPLIQDPDGIVKFRKMFKGVGKYVRFSAQEIMDAGDKGPLYAPFIDSEEGHALERALQSIGFRGSRLKLAEHFIWLNSQFDIIGISPSSLEERRSLFMFPDKDLAEIDLSKREYDACFSTICTYCNMTPKWVLRGSTPEVSGYMYLDPDVDREDDLVQDSEDQSLDIQDLENPHWHMPKPTVTAGFGFSFGMSVPKVAPDDPCPCGSGLKYKNCHGRHVS